MMRLFGLALAVAAFPVFGQMTREQRSLDFQHLAALYAKQYAPYEWKRDGVGFDMMKLAPWLARIDAAKDDLQYLEICVEYVAALKDGHSQFFVPSNFFADNGLFIDLYEGKAYVDLVNRRLLPASEYPVREGDEVVSVDGKDPVAVARESERFVSSGNARARTRYALDLLTFRPQAFLPRAHEIGESSRFVFRHADGSQETLDIPWFKVGEPLRVIGPVPAPFTREESPAEPAGPGVEPALAGTPFRALTQLHKTRVASPRAIRGVAVVQPLFAMPQGFVQRLGRGRDAIFSGTYTASEKRIGFIRIPEMFTDAFSANIALGQIVQELNFMQRNTDGLVVDLMRNPGGDACLTQDLVSLLMPEQFTMPGIEIRATREWISRYESTLAQLEILGAPEWLTNQWRALLGDIKGAYSENRGRTGPLPICDFGLEVDPAVDRNGNRISYTKPLMVLIDDISASAAEIFAGAIQDNRRGVIFGMPTLGAGGTVTPSPLAAGWYAETSATVTQSLIVRSRAISSNGEFPTAPYVENIGIRPDIAGDIMTVENLRNAGRPYVAAFTAAMVNHIQESGN
ncbi:MAG: S41 family peptidase [Bryobacteraceae bacterium]|nr:S41 family peptidase [Bryobacteraceae bacterium]